MQMVRDGGWSGVKRMVHDGGWSGVKRMVHVSEAVAERLTTDVVLWYRFRCKRVYHFVVAPGSDLGQAIAKGESPAAVTTALGEQQPPATHEGL